MKVLASFFTIQTFLKLVQSENVTKMDYFQHVSTCLDHSSASLETQLVSGNSRFTCPLRCIQVRGCMAYSVDEETDRCYIYQAIISEDSCGDTFSYYNSLEGINNYCYNGGVLKVETNTCTCFNSYVGDRCQRLMKGCYEGFQSGHYTGQKTVFTIQLKPSATPIQAYCEMKFGGQLFLMRQTIDIAFVNFSRGMEDYINGFGDLNGGNHWLGLEKIHQISASGVHNLVVETYPSDFVNKQRFYKDFLVGDAANGYSFTFTSSFPNEKDGGVYILDDCLEELRDQPFSAIDIDNDSSTGNCAQSFKSGWWFRDCARCNPTGVIQPISDEFVSADPTFMSWPLASNRSTRSIKLFLKHVTETQDAN